MRFDWRSIGIWSAIFTIIGEAITAALRFGRGISAEEFNRSAPLLLQIHHMFWSLPLFVLAGIAYACHRPRIAGILIALAIGCIASDLAHHFIVLPLTVGNTGWHWP